MITKKPKQDDSESPVTKGFLREVVREAIDELAQATARGFQRMEDKMVTKDEFEEFKAETKENFRSARGDIALLDKKIGQINYFHKEKTDSLENKVHAIKNVIEKDLKTKVQW